MMSAQRNNVNIVFVLLIRGAPLKKKNQMQISDIQSIEDLSVCLWFKSNYDFSDFSLDFVLV